MVLDGTTVLVAILVVLVIVIICQYFYKSSGCVSDTDLQFFPESRVPAPSRNHYIPSQYGAGDTTYGSGFVNNDRYDRTRQTQRRIDQAEADMFKHPGDPMVDNQDRMVEHVATGRTRKNHDEWAAGVIPYSNAMRSVDNMDEAVGAAHAGMGLYSFRQKPVPVVNPMQLNEYNGEYGVGENSTFTFSY
jgi:hypothetical protein